MISFGEETYGPILSEPSELKLAWKGSVYYHPPEEGLHGFSAFY